MNIGRSTKNELAEQIKSILKWLDYEHNRLYDNYTKAIDKEKNLEYYHRITEIEHVIDRVEEIFGVDERNDVEEDIRKAKEEANEE